MSGTHDDDLDAPDGGRKPPSSEVARRRTRSASEREEADGSPVTSPEGRPLPVDTAVAPHEPTVPIASTLPMWAIVLTGPVAWIVHFGVVYLFAEASCAAERDGRLSFVGTEATEVVVVAATLIAVAVVVAVGLLARRRSAGPGASGMYRIGSLLAWLFAAAIVVVGVPVLVVPVC